jgi:hypothetical protein
VLRRVVEFMQKCGTAFNFDKFKIISDLLKEYKEGGSGRLLRIYDDFARRASFFDCDVKRAMHLRNTIFTSKQSKAYLNVHHQQLCKIENPDNKDCKLSVVDSHPRRIQAASNREIQFLKLAFVIAMFYILYNKYYTAVENVKSNRDLSPRF